MAKLTKSEINALAYEIRNELVKAQDERYKESDEKAASDFYKTSLGKTIKKIMKFERELDIRILYRDCVRNLVEKEERKSLPSIYDIERKIIIEQIMAEDVNGLIKAVKDHYTEDS